MTPDSNLILAWKTAHRALSRDAWIQRWKEVGDLLNGRYLHIADTANPYDKDVVQTMEDILWLRDLAMENRHNFTVI